MSTGILPADSDDESQNDKGGNGGCLDDRKKGRKKTADQRKTKSEHGKKNTERGAEHETEKDTQERVSHREPERFFEEKNGKATCHFKR